MDCYFSWSLTINYGLWPGRSDGRLGRWRWFRRGGGGRRWSSSCPRNGCLVIRCIFSSFLPFKKSFHTHSGVYMLWGCGERGGGEMATALVNKNQKRKWKSGKFVRNVLKCLKIASFWGYTHFLGGGGWIMFKSLTQDFIHYVINEYCRGRIR